MVSDVDRVELARRVRAKGSPAQEVERARIVLLAAEGVPGIQIAARVGCAEPPPPGAARSAGRAARRRRGPPSGPSWSAPISRSRGSGALAIPGEVVFGTRIVPKGENTRLRILEAGCRCIPTNQGGMTLRVRTSGGSLIWEHTLTTPSVRYSTDDGQASYVAGNNLSAGQEIRFVLVNASGAARVACGHITYGWGSLRV